MTTTATASPDALAGLAGLGDEELRRAVAGMVDAGTLTEDTPELLELLVRVRARRDRRDADNTDTEA